MEPNTSPDQYIVRDIANPWVIHCKGSASECIDKAVELVKYWEVDIHPTEVIVPAEVMKGQENMYEYAK